MPKKQAFIDKSGVKFVENFQKNQKIKKFPSRTEIRYLTAFMQKSQIAYRQMADLKSTTNSAAWSKNSRYIIYNGYFYEWTQLLLAI